MTVTANRSRFRRLVKDKKLLVIPGVYDPLTAQVVARTGFDAVYLSGSAVSSGHYGKPDVGLITLTEMVSIASRVADAVDIPVISDADEGYGNALNVIRTVQEFERSGVAAIHIEDQVHPKRCGHFSGKEIVSVEEMVGKIRAALDARIDPNFLIIARTDARGPYGVDEAIRRAQSYRKAGADLIMFDAALTVEEIRRYPREVDAPLILTLGGYARQRTTPKVPLEMLQAAGYSVVIFPLAVVRAASHAAWEFCQDLQHRGTQAEMDFLRKIEGHPIEDWYEFVGTYEYRKMEDNYIADEVIERKYKTQFGHQLNINQDATE